MNADNPAGRKSADSCRAERVAHLNGALIQLYKLGQKADAQEWSEAKEALRVIRVLFEKVETSLDDESEARERQRSGEALHGEDSQDAQMSIPGA